MSFFVFFFITRPNFENPGKMFVAEFFDVKNITA